MFCDLQRCNFSFLCYTYTNFSLCNCFCSFKFYLLMTINILALLVLHQCSQHRSLQVCPPWNLVHVHVCKQVALCTHFLSIRLSALEPRLHLKVKQLGLCFMSITYLPNSGLSRTLAQMFSSLIQCAYGKSQPIFAEGQCQV